MCWGLGIYFEGDPRMEVLVRRLTLLCIWALGNAADVTDKHPKDQHPSEVRVEMTTQGGPTTPRGPETGQT